MKEMKSMKEVLYIAVHCSATRKSQKWTVADLDHWHHARGWACCGYHWVILQDGTIQVVRIMLMYYIDVMGFLDYPEKDWEAAVE
ncbi:MAG: hypothetical protein K6G32_02240 [Prevotella sp.]|nr:hypothetical protein [Prevotella sp.]